jgi:hypothetical protein
VLGMITRSDVLSAHGRRIADGHAATPSIKLRWPRLSRAPRKSA